MPKQAKTALPYQRSDNYLHSVHRSTVKVLSIAPFIIRIAWWFVGNATSRY